MGYVYLLHHYTLELLEKMFKNFRYLQSWVYLALQQETVHYNLMLFKADMFFLYAELKSLLYKLRKFKEWYISL